MKLKKIVCLAAVAAMSLSAIGASASGINVPKPNNNDEAYAYAESFYHDGYYYEAQAELNLVNPYEMYYDANKQAAWLEQVNYKLERLAIQNIIAEVKALNSQLKFQDALNKLYEVNSYSITENEYYGLVWWENALISNLNNPKYAAKAEEAKEITGLQAIAAVKAAGYAINSDYDWYSPVKAVGGYSVYVKTRTPSGEAKDVAAFYVENNGTVTRAF